MLREYVTDSAERTGDEVRAASTERGHVGRREGHANAYGFGHEACRPAPSDHAVGRGEQLVDRDDGTGGPRACVEVDEHGREVGIFSRGDEHGAESQRVDGPCGHPARCGRPARDHPEASDAVWMVAERTCGVDGVA